LLPVRLGVELNPAYLPFLLETFKFPQSLGFAGGKIGTSISSMLTLGKLRTQRAVRSMYFVAIDDQQGTYFLDPHKTQDALHFDQIDDLAPEDFSSFHYFQDPKKTTIDQIDPSLLLGFYCRDKRDFEDFCERTERLTKESRPAVFALGTKKPVYKEDANILTEDPKNTAKWTEAGPGESLQPYKPEVTSSGIGNPRPQVAQMDLAELATFHSSNGAILGTLILTQGFLIFEPLRQDPLVRKNGSDKYRWWIRVPFIESCKIMEDITDIEDRNSDDFIVLNSQVESDRQPDARASAYWDDSAIMQRPISSDFSHQQDHSRSGESEDEDSVAV